jgi:hypothetical protein
MSFTSILKPDGSIAIGLATAVFVYTIYSKELPDTATIHATDAGDINIEAARKKAVYTAAAAVTAVTLLTKDISVLTLGAASIFALDMHTRHANAANKDTGMLVSQGGGYDTQLRSVS